MYKRRDYNLLHANNQKDASDSSSSSDSEVEADARIDGQQGPSSDSEDEGESLKSLAVEGESDADKDCQSWDYETGKDLALSSDEEVALVERRQRSQGAQPSNPWAEAVEETERGRIEVGDEELVVQVGKVFKCRVCPSVLCLNEATKLAHLNSKKHARYVQQLAAGTGRLLVDSDGEDLAEEAETHAERHARMLQLAAAKGATSEAADKDPSPKKKRRKESGRQRQRKRLKMKEQVADATSIGKKKDGAESSKRPQEGDRNKSKLKTPNRKERRKDLPKNGPNASAGGPVSS